jgi:hypothetical protein
MGDMQTMKPVGLLPNALNSFRANERRIVLHLDQSVMSKHSLKSPRGSSADPVAPLHGFVVRAHCGIEVLKALLIAAVNYRWRMGCLNGSERLEYAIAVMGAAGNDPRISGFEQQGLVA